jgi:hypothetical protein
VADEFRGGGDILRSWDQPLAVNAGLAWKGAQASVSALAGWHRGWPTTRLDLTPQLLGPRNAERWGDYYTLDLRGSWTWEFATGDLSLVLDVTNATHRRNECCLVLEQEGAAIESEVDHWLPVIFNLGVTYRRRD